MEKQIYLDNAATTKPYAEAVQKATEVMTAKWGNPSASYSFGERSKAVITTARKQVAHALGALSHEIYFTSGGTEADNLAILGAVTAHNKLGKHVVTTAVEHSAVSKTVRNLRREHGCEVTYVPMDGGNLDLNALEQAITDETVLVSVMLVQNEVGTIFPLREISRVVKRKNPDTLLHCDAVQGFGKLPFMVDSLGVDLLSVSAHKIHGVSGCGALYVRDGVSLFARQFGGGQENGLRSGTESVALISAFGEAVRITFENLATNAAKMAALRDYALTELLKNFPNVILNTDKSCAPHIVSFTLPGIDALETVQSLGEQGIYISNGAACKSNERSDDKRKQALEYYGLTDAHVRSTLRVSFCAENTVADIDAMIEALKNAAIA